MADNVFCGYMAMPEYQRVKLIGVGATAHVFEVTWFNQEEAKKETAVVKRISLSMDESMRDEQISRLNKMMQQIAGIQHVNILKHLAFSTEAPKPEDQLTPYYFKILTTYCDGGTLRKKAEDGLPILWIQHYIKQLIAAIVFLHSKRVIHRDIKSENIFLSGKEGEHLVLGDLGEMKQLQATVTGRHEVSKAGTEMFMAPEMHQLYKDGIKVGRKSDIWSFGCVLVQMEVGRHHVNFVMQDKLEVVNPTEIGRDNLVKFVLNGGRPCARSSLITEEETVIGIPQLRDITSKALKTIPEERSSASELLQHPFITTDFGLVRKNLNGQVDFKIGSQLSENVYIGELSCGKVVAEYIKLSGIPNYEHSICLEVRRRTVKNPKNYPKIIKVVQTQYLMPTDLWEQPSFVFFWEYQLNECLSIGDILNRQFQAPDPFPSSAFAFRELVEHTVIACCHLPFSWPGLFFTQVPKLLFLPVDTPSRFTVKLHRQLFPRQTDDAARDISDMRRVFLELIRKTSSSFHCLPAIRPYLPTPPRTLSCQISFVLAQLSAFLLRSLNETELSIAMAQVYRFLRYCADWNNEADDRPDALNEFPVLKLLPPDFVEFLNEVIAWMSGLVVDFSFTNLHSWRPTALLPTLMQQVSFAKLDSIHLPFLKLEQATSCED